MKHLFLSSDILLLTFTAIELLATTKFIFIFFSANNNSHVTHAFTVLRTCFQKLTSWDLFNLRTSLDWSEGNGLIFHVNRSCPLDNYVHFMCTVTTRTLQESALMYCESWSRMSLKDVFYIWSCSSLKIINCKSSIPCQVLQWHIISPEETHVILYN